MEPGDNYKLEFSFTQSEVEDFAHITGDTNPIHLNAEYASRTVFKKPIIHGFLGASIFSKIMGTLFPGEGTIYLSQQLEFKRPMYADTNYLAILTIKEVDPDKHQAVIETTVLDAQTSKVVISGEAKVVNREKI